MRLHLVDGTYELFRAYFGAPKAFGRQGGEVGATRGLLRSMLFLLGEPGVTHVGVAFDHVIESFRNDLFDGYKTSEGVPEDLLAQFPLAERACAALGLVVWPMVEFEADDALGTATARWQHLPEVEQVVICTPDKDLAQCVRGSHIVLLDRMRRKVLDEPGVVEKFGVPPDSIPDWLALVGDTSDGYPGVPRWGAKSAAAVLSRLPASRGHSGARKRVARERARRGQPGRQPARPSRRGVPVSPPGDAALRRAADRAARRPALAGGPSPGTDGALRRARRRLVPRARESLGRLSLATLVQP